MTIDYFIGVNDPEIDRLRRQHEAWRPETERLWTDAGFGAGASIADFGCGPGFTTMDLSRVVGPSGRVCAVDKAPSYLEYLIGQARSAGVTNITTLEADVTLSGSISERFDGAFCRWFLAFLRDDLDAVLGNIRAALRPGDVFAAMEYLTLRSVTCSPPSPAFDAHTRAWIEFYDRHGGDSSVGQSLPQRLAAAGFSVRSIECVGGMADPSHRWWHWWGRLIHDFGPKFVDAHLMRPEAWVALESEWAVRSQSSSAFIYTPILLQVIAERT